MNLKIKFNKEIHIYKGAQNYGEVMEYIKTAFKNLPEKFSLFYEDEDSDEITVSCQQDLESMIECNEKLPKLQIKEVEQSEQEEEETKEKEQQQENTQQQQQQQQNPNDLFANLLNMGTSFMKQCGEHKKGPKNGKKQCEFFKNMAGQFNQFTPQFEQMAQQFANPNCFMPQQEENSGQQQHGAQFFQNMAEQMNSFTPQFEEMAQQFANPEFYSAFVPKQEQKKEENQEKKKEEEVNTKDDEEEIDQFLSKGPKELVLKQFDEEILLKACSVSEVLGGDINDYLGVCEAYKERDLDYIVERLTIDPQLTEKFSSYE